MAGLLIPVSPRDHSRGPSEASLVLVQYADFQCAHCAHLHPIVDEIRRELKDSLRIIFRQFPLSQVHPRAKAAALELTSADEANSAGVWPQGCVSTALIVVLAPRFDLGPGICQAQEPMHVQALAPQPAAEAFDEALSVGLPSREKFSIT